MLYCDETKFFTVISFHLLFSEMADAATGTWETVQSQGGLTLS